jgi:glutamate-1-semialdehyde 2,1-aminomutase
MDLVAPLGPVYQAGTLSANPVGMVAGLATLKKCERHGAWEALHGRMEKFASLLDEGLAGTGFALTRFASLFWIHARAPAPIRSIDSIPAGHGKAFPAFFRAALARGVYLAPNGYEVGFLSLAHTEEKLAQAAKALSEAAHEAGSA